MSKIIDKDKPSITKEEIAKHLYETQKRKFTMAECAQIVDLFFDAAKAHILENKKLLLTHFGSFKLVERSERPGRDFATGETVTITPRTVVRFSSAGELRRKINNTVFEPALPPSLEALTIRPSNHQANFINKIDVLIEKFSCARENLLKLIG